MKQGGVEQQKLSVTKLIKTGEPECVCSVPLDAREKTLVKSELSEHNGLILRGWLVVLRSIRGEVHEGLKGLERFRERA